MFIPINGMFVNWFVVVVVFAHAVVVAVVRPEVGGLLLSLSPSHIRREFREDRAERKPPPLC